MRDDKTGRNIFDIFITEKVKNVFQARKKLRETCGEAVLTVRECQNWFSKFRR